MYLKKKLSKRDKSKERNIEMKIFKGKKNKS